MGKLSLEEFARKADEGESFRLNMGEDWTELRLRSPSRADAEAVADLLSTDPLQPLATLGQVRKAEHTAILACCPEVTEETVAAVRAAGGLELQDAVFSLCGILHRTVSGEQEEDAPGKPSPSATP